MMTTYYVATLARYILVDANDEAQARAKGLMALHERRIFRIVEGDDVPSLSI